MEGENGENTRGKPQRAAEEILVGMDLHTESSRKQDENKERGSEDEERERD